MNAKRNTQATEATSRGRKPVRETVPPQARNPSGRDAATGTSSIRELKHRQQMQAYLAHYGFDQDPFSDHGSGLFFAGGGRKKAIDSLLHFARYGTAALFLTGANGSGKTSVLQAFIGELDSDVDIALINAGLMMATGQIIAEVVARFGLDAGQNELANLERQVYTLLDFAEAATARSRQVLICIDNTQDLSAEVLQNIVDIVVMSKGNLKLILVGEQSTVSLIEAAVAQADMLLNRIELNNFNQQDVEAYIHYRLSAVGYSGELPFSDIQLKALCYRSQGSLIQLNQVARSMLIAAIDGAKPEGSPFPYTHLLALIVLVALIALSWQQDSEQPVTAELEPIVLETVPTSNRQESSSAALISNGSDSTGELSPANNQDRDESALASKKIKTAEEVKRQLAQLSQDVTATTDVSFSAEPDAPKPDAEAQQGNTDSASAARTSTRTAQIDGQVADDTTTISDSIATEVAVDALGDTPANQALARSSSPASEASGQASSTADTLAAPIGSSNSESAAEVGSESSDSARLDTHQLPSDPRLASAHQRLMAWSDAGYALQIFGTYNAKRARQLVDEYFGQADLLFYETRHNGKRWYVVVNGPYTGREAAKKSMASLPESLQRLRPWPRNIASIQADIRRFSAATVTRNTPSP